MVSVVSSYGATQYGAGSTVGTASSAQASSSASSTSTSDGTGSNASRVVADSVSISAQAQAAADQLQAENAVPAPKSFAQVATDARSALDQSFARMQANGKPFDPVHATEEDWDQTFGQLDRRSLFAIASNEGGHFSKEEQEIAQSVMARQQGKAMGLYGPMGSTSMTRDPTPGFADGIAFLDTVSDEEKASTNWQVQRASLQWSYESTFDQHHAGEKKEDFSTDDPMVNMLLKTFRSMEHSDYLAVTDGTYVSDVDELRQMPAFSDSGINADLNDAVTAAASRNG